MSFLFDLQSKSSATKARYAFVFASLVTGFIAIVWFTTIPARFSEVKSEEKKEGGTQADFLNDTKSQLGNIVNWDQGKTEASPEEAPTNVAPNMEQLNLEVGDTVYAEDTTSITPPKPKEEATLPEPDLEKTPGIVMPTNIAPQQMPESTPEVPVYDAGGKKVLIEVTNTPPKPILIETKTEPQKVPRN